MIDGSERQEYVPLICDEPVQHRYVLKCERHLSAEQAAYMDRTLRHRIDNPGKLLVLGPGMDLVWPGPRVEWPDATHCAA